MVSKLLTVALFFSLLSCEKKYEKSDNSNVEVVNQLNQGMPDQVIDRLSLRGELSDRETHYLASAYALKGGVDVFSLYSILEIQLFHKKALDWSDLSKEKNPYLKFMKSQSDVNFSERRKKREAKWDKYLGRIKDFRGYREKPQANDLKEGWGNCEKVTQEMIEELDLDMDEKFKKVQDDPNLTYENSYDKIYEEFSSIMNEHPEKHNHYESGRWCAYYALERYYYDKLDLHISKANYLNPEAGAGRKSVFSKVQWEMLYMNILWNTYESIPMMKKLPTLTDEQQSHVTLSLEEYAKLINKKGFKESSLKSLAILTGVSLLSVYKQSFDLDDVASIQDLYCSLEPEVLVNNYDLIRKRLFFIADVIEASDVKMDAIEAYRQDVEEFKEKMPEHLDEEKISTFIDKVEDYKVKNCFNS